DVTIGSDTVVEAGVVLKGQTKIGAHCFIGAHSEIIDSTLADHVSVTSSHIEGAIIHEQSDIGPFGRIRPGSELGPEVHIGNFVEVKNATLGKGTKAGHLTYIGDATLGQEINVGCGTIFVNYDGKNKFHTSVGDHTFIGCNANLLAPVKIGANSFIAAGSTITEDVPDESLAI